MVISRTGSASSPLRMRSPSAPVEKSPLTGFTPECRPDTPCTRTPLSIPAMSSSGARSPGTSDSAWQPTPGVLA